MVDNSNLVSWSPAFSVGIKIIDDQHKELLNLTNNLFNHCIGDEQSEREYFKSVIQEAVHYIKVHFSTEEKIMQRTEYPGYSEHRRQHEAFVLTVVQMVRDFESGKKFTLASFTKFLKEWVLTHIAISDKKYFEHFKRLATRKPDGRLTISKSDVERYSAVRRI